MKKQIELRVSQAIEEKRFPGCVIGVIRNGEREILPFGTLDYREELVTEETVYDLASVTKSIPIGSLTLTCIEEGKLALSDKVKKFIPELANDHGATVEDLLRYRVKGVQMSKLQHSTFEEIRTHALEHGFDAAPGESVYTNLPAFVLGIALERVSGASIAALAEKYFFGPLNMERTTFFPATTDCAPTEIVGDETIRGIPHDESARVFARARRSVGHAGLFSTASDLLIFLEALLSQKLEHIVRGAEQGLGWEVNQQRWMGELAGERTFGKTGFTGTSVLVDIERRLGVVILSNRTYPQRPSDGTAIDAFRRDIAGLVLSPNGSNL